MWLFRAGLAQVLAALAIAAIAVRALIPAGYMLAPVNDGRHIAIVLCSGHEAVLDINTGKLIDSAQPPGRDDRSDQSGDAPCVFAATTALAAPEFGAVLSAPLMRSALRVDARAAIAPGRGLAAPPPWATGPPLTA